MEALDARIEELLCDSDKYLEAHDAWALEVALTDAIRDAINKGGRREGMKRLLLAAEQKAVDQAGLHAPDPG